MVLIMADGESKDVVGDSKPSRAGTLWDWPVAVIIVGVLLAMLAWSSGGRPSFITWLLILFGVVSLMVRRGAFKPR